MLTSYQRSHWLHGHMFFTKSFAQTKKFRKIVFPVHMGPRWSFWEKKGRKSRNTVPLSLDILVWRWPQRTIHQFEKNKKMKKIDFFYSEDILGFTIIWNTKGYNLEKQPFFQSHFRRHFFVQTLVIYMYIAIASFLLSFKMNIFQGSLTVV